MKKKIIKWLEIIILILFSLIFFSKSYTIVFAGSYFLCLLIYNIKENDRKELHNTLIEGIIFCLGVALGYFIIYAINNFQTGTNHYSTQIMSIFPITLEKIGYLIYGIFGYLVFPIFSFGILPVLIPLFNYKEYSKEDKKFLMFIVIGTILTAIESALIVYIPEEAGKTFPAKICVRYLAVFMIPYILFFINLKDKNIKISKWIYIVCAILCTYLIVYSIEASKNFTYIDAFVFMFLSMLEVMRNKYASAIVIGGVFAFVFIWLELKRRKKINGIFSYQVRI